MEEWKQIPKYTQYEISSFGRIRHTKHLKIRKYKIDASGYYALSLNQPNIKKQNVVRVHRLMGIAFMGVAGSNDVVDHIDRNRLNNTLSNLRLTTQIQNMSNKSINRQTIERIIRMSNSGRTIDQIVASICY